MDFQSLLRVFISGNGNAWRVRLICNEDFRWVQIPCSPPFRSCRKVGAPIYCGVEKVCLATLIRWKLQTRTSASKAASATI